MPLSPETRKEITDLVQAEFVNQDTRWRAYLDEMFGRVTRQLDPNGNPPGKDGLPIRSLVEEVVNWVRSK